MDLRDVSSLAAWADGHEKLCGERNDALQMRIGRIETMVIGIAATLILGGGTVLWQVLKIGAKLG